MSPSPFQHHRIEGFEQTYIPNVQSSIFLVETHIRTVPCGWSYPEHAETMFEINFIMEGEQSTRLGEHQFRLQPSDSILFRPRELHENRCGHADGLTYLCLHFDLDDPMFRRLLCTGRQLYFPSHDPRTIRIQACLKRFIRMTKRKNGNPLLSRMKFLSLSIQLFAAIAEYLLEDAAQAPPFSIRNWQLAHQAADRFEHYLHELLSGQGEKPPGKDIVSTIADELGISTSYLHRVFRQSFAVSPRQYFTSLVLSRAKRLLLDEQLTIEEIARQLGYYDQSHFSRQFKRWTGHSPSAFR